MNYSDYINSNSLTHDVNISLSTHNTYFYEERMCRTLGIIYGIMACRSCKHGLWRPWGDKCNLRELSRLYEYVV